MVVEIVGDTVASAYIDGLQQLRISGIREESRNGPVLSIPRPVVLTILSPWRRVLVDAVRKPNPYFHLAEFVWMMAGANSALWLSYYNSRYMEYAEDNGRVHGAYGDRWMNHFGLNQVAVAIEELKRDPTSRRVVLGMWDPDADLGTNARDLPCNTHIYFRTTQRAGGDPQLNMTVCNRSNDYIWGMMGANVVHMTLLHELISNAIGVQQGVYTVFTNNLHMYEQLPGSEQIRQTLVTSGDPYRRNFQHIPLLQPQESFQDFLLDCWVFVQHGLNFKGEYASRWFDLVFLPMMRAYAARKQGGDDLPHLAEVKAHDWQTAGLAWKGWKANG